MADRSRLNTLAIGDWFLFLTQDLHKKELKIKVIRSVEHLLSVALRTSDWGARRASREPRINVHCSCVIRSVRVRHTLTRTIRSKPGAKLLYGLQPSFPRPQHSLNRSTCSLPAPLMTWMNPTTSNNPTVRSTSSWTRASTKAKTRAISTLYYQQSRSYKYNKVVAF